MGRARRLGWMLLLLGTSVGCDQATKNMAVQSLKGTAPQSFLGDLFRLQYAENSGAFLSLGAGTPSSVRFWVFVVGVGVMLLGLVLAALMNAKAGPLQWVGLTLVASGGLGNWLDRVRDGVVVDFMNMGIGWLRTGIFNVADVAIMVGAALVILDGRFKRPTPPPGRSPSATA